MYWWEKTNYGLWMPSCYMGRERCIWHILASKLNTYVTCPWAVQVAGLIAAPEQDNEDGVSPSTACCFSCLVQKTPSEAFKRRFNSDAIPCELHVQKDTGHRLHESAHTGIPLDFNPPKET